MCTSCLVDVDWGGQVQRVLLNRHNTAFHIEKINWKADIVKTVRHTLNSRFSSFNKYLEIPINTHDYLHVVGLG
jgi:dUTPase